jgi:hypothetical protein
MVAKERSKLVAALAAVPDPRRQCRNLRHRLADVLVLGFCAVMDQRHRQGIENLALLNRLAVSVLRQDQQVEAGVKFKRKTAGWNDDYLLHLLFNSP